MNPTAMSLDSIRIKAPAAFSNVASGDMSGQYAHVNTSKVVDALLQDGWLVTDAAQKRSKTADALEHGNHRITLWHPELPEHAEGRPQMYLGNAGNGSAAFRTIGGFLRAACLNQLFAGIKVVGGVFHHRGRGLEDRIVAGARDLRHNFDKVINVVDLWREVQLTPEQQTAFALAALPLRFPNTEVEVEGFGLASMMRPRRYLDKVETTSLWSTFNRTQEALIRGGFNVMKVNRDEAGTVIGKDWQSVRRVTGLTANARINSGLWEQASLLAK